MELQGKKCLITGGAGFIGSNLADKLVDKGCWLRILDNLSNGKYENIEHHEKSGRLQFIQGNVLESADISKAMDGVEVVFHLACLGVRHSIAHPFENHQVNAEGTLNVLTEAEEAPAWDSIVGEVIPQLSAPPQMPVWRGLDSF